MKKTAVLCIMILSAALAGAQPFESVTYKVFNQNYPPLECIGSVQTLPSGEVAAERWSVGYECVDRGMAEYSESGSYISQLGVGRARIQSGWARTEHKKGKYDYAWLDEVVDGIVSQNVTPWMCLGYGNPIYSSEVTLGAKIFTDEPTMKAWERYVETTVARYKGKVGLWEVWNEPNQKVNKDNPSTYTNLLVRTCEAIRRVDPDARIAAFALASVDA
ncbi:MAG: glycoside hydrolase, partial [Bacteroidales bacterium]|nr:glycoside hydrolase [Bacteroidales bacterium]